MLWSTARCFSLALLILILASCSIQDPLAISNTGKGNSDTDLDVHSDVDTATGDDAKDAVNSDDARDRDSDTDLAPTCEDGVQNNAETDIDCGGPNCPPCNADASCQGASDCVSGVCSEGICQAPSCDDHIYNGEESDIDCGGPDCGLCDIGQSCRANSDCASRACHEHTCVECFEDDHCPIDQACSEDNKCFCQDSRTIDDICADASAQCGEVLDVCGQPVQCARCSGDTLCENNLCVGCITSDDCEGLFCDTDSNICIQCLSDNDCDGCRSCSESGFCVSNDALCSGCQTCFNGSCSDNSALCTGEEGVCVGAQCVECTTGNHCAPNQVCSANRCVECSNDNQCPGHQFCANNECVECLSNDHCGTDEICSGNKCICPTPSCSGIECGPIKSACGATNSCGSCGENQHCDDNVCVCHETRTDIEVCAAAETFCGNVSDICGDIVHCGSCAPDQICSNGQCVECTANSHCDTDEICSGNECICPTPSCAGVQCGTVTNACGASNHCSGCSLATPICNDNRCVECTVDGDCPGGTCFNFQCVECIHDSDCPADVLGNWGACTRRPGNSCEGIRSRTRRTYSCVNQACTPSTSTDTGVCYGPGDNEPGVWHCSCSDSSLGTCSYGHCCGAFNNEVCDGPAGVPGSPGMQCIR